MKQFFFFILIIFLFLINEFYIKNKIGNLIKKFTKFSNSFIFLITICLGYYTYKNKTELFIDLINPKSKSKISDIGMNVLNDYLTLKTNNFSNTDLKINVDNDKNNHLSKNINNNFNNNGFITKNLNSNQLNNSEKKDNIKKRSVSETKKKFVAANQSWKCNKCNNMLDASFEVHHINPLYRGGNNENDNLVALCRNCHGKETVLEKINSE